MRLIDADKITFFDCLAKTGNAVCCHAEGIVSKSAIEMQPTVDAIPIGVYEQVKGERDVAIEQLKSLNIELFEKPYLKAIPIEWIKKHNYSNLIDLWEKECRLKTTKDVLNELLSEHNFKSYSDYVEYAGKITALPRDDRLDLLFKERENETN